MKLLVILTFIISLKTCGCSTKTLFVNQNETMKSASIHGNYFIKTLYGMDISDNNLYINFDNEKHMISGFSGCNRFSGSYELESNKIKIGPLAATRMLCEETANQLEFKMYEALSQADEVIIENKVLKLKNGDQEFLTAVQDSAMGCTYTAQSRGAFLEIEIDDSIFTVKKDRKSNPIAQSLNREKQNSLQKLLENMDLENLSNLKAPTEARLYDGAAIGKLKIRSNGVTYESVPFDHGKPPLEIEALVKEILSLSEKIE